MPFFRLAVCFMLGAGVTCLAHWILSRLRKARQRAYLKSEIRIRRAESSDYKPDWDNIKANLPFGVERREDEGEEWRR